MEFLANKFGYSGNAQMLRRDFLRFYGVTPVAISKVKKLEWKQKDYWLRQHIA